MLTRLGLAPLWREARIAWYEWALQEMPASHADVPYVVMRIHALKAERLSAGARRRAI